MFNQRYFARLLAGTLVLLLAACSSGPLFFTPSKKSNIKTRSYHRTAKRTEKPYKIKGRWYYPQHSLRYNKVGMASWYGAECHNQKTATADRFDMYAITAAHRTLPLPCVARVTCLETGRSINVVVNDRGPFAETHRRIIDLSLGAARALGMHRKGLTRVRVECLPKETKKLRQSGRYP